MKEIPFSTLKKMGAGDILAEGSFNVTFNLEYLCTVVVPFPERRAQIEGICSQMNAAMNLKE